MALIPILFLALNIAFPVWLWSGTSNSATQVEWNVWGKNMARLVESDGGFPPCSTLQVVDVLQTVCEESEKKWTDKQSTVVERAGKEVVFVCEFKKTALSVHWYRESNPNADLDCGDPGGDMITRAPGFVFIPNGRLKSLEFTGDNGVRQTVPYRNCRIKAKRSHALLPVPSDEEAFLRLLGKTANDPPDYVTANHMCLLFDSSPIWRQWRQKFLQ